MPVTKEAVRMQVESWEYSRIRKRFRILGDSPIVRWQRKTKMLRSLRITGDAGRRSIKQYKRRKLLSESLDRAFKKLNPNLYGQEV